MRKLRKTASVGLSIRRATAYTLYNLPAYVERKEMENVHCLLELKIPQTDYPRKILQLHIPSL